MKLHNILGVLILTTSQHKSLEASTEGANGNRHASTSTQNNQNTPKITAQSITDKLNALKRQYVHTNKTNALKAN